MGIKSCDFKDRLWPAWADIPAGVAAVRARIHTGRLKVVASACPNLLEEARHYRYRLASSDCPPREWPINITTGIAD
jgi:hypothetical protein